MLEIQRIREEKQELADKLMKVRKADYSTELEKAFHIDEEKRKIQQKLDSAKATLNQLSSQIGTLYKQGNTSLANETKTKTSDLKEDIKKMKDRFISLEKQLNDVLMLVPNVPNDLVPEGINESDNEQVFVSDYQELGNDLFPHWDLAKKYNLIDFELGVKITGAGFPVYIGKGAILQRALIQFFLNEGNKVGYNELLVPHLVNEDSGFGTGQLPDKEGQMYHVVNDDLYLIPTAEVPITNVYRGNLIAHEDLPIKHVGYTPCFRREAGSYGKDVRGLNRLHQFDKVEIVQITSQEKSYDTLNEMKDHIEGLIRKLGLPFRILKLCGGDLGFTSALTYDFEVFSVGQKKWLEVSSVSNFETFQANRLKLRYRSPVDNKPKLAHTLNGSALALPRILASLLEFYQSPEGVKIPDVLVPYTGFEWIN
ncbi:serine--tRNA ligase [Bacteroidota bacterium]|nr:serine--tRNA ligase [Bacteroidota bacterium]GIR59694.1 MAG: serine--tRNA ligase [Crocinitomicaceae bacterium]MEC7954892.1 serine--tRNA ligase [Bacteroidota bacterium]MEC7999276.1 serine--tRNA ligase [Bacteroidota bacterium]MEC8605832.1 serine--tRNA ligase [Bacteroidota bacterium]|tara:strand:- start:1777 stop:3051 length:1275 start_codon:yes stop_codon:yes gene_type:complete